MVVVDTNILAQLLIEGERTAEAQALYALDSDWRSEAFVLIELSNVLATYLKKGTLDRAAAHKLLDSAQEVLAGMVNLPHRRALDIASEHGVSAYDARYLGAALGLGAKLVTEDTRLRRAAPALTVSLEQALAA